MRRRCNRSPPPRRPTPFLSSQSHSCSCCAEMSCRLPVALLYWNKIRCESNTKISWRESRSWKGKSNNNPHMCIYIYLRSGLKVKGSVCWVLKFALPPLNFSPLWTANFKTCTGPLTQKITWPLLIWDVDIVTVTAFLIFDQKASVYQGWWSVKSLTIVQNFCLSRQSPLVQWRLIVTQKEPFRELE